MYHNDEYYFCEHGRDIDDVREEDDRHKMDGDYQAFSFEQEFFEREYFYDEPFENEICQKSDSIREIKC